MPTTLTIGKLAANAEVNVQTIRYYERRGLVPEPARNTAGYRRYSPDAVSRVRFIRAAKRVGFSLDDIEELLSYRASPRRSCKGVREKALTKIAEVEEKLAELKRLRDALVRIVGACDGNRPMRDCAILAAFDESHRPRRRRVRHA
jgi:Hg(II)-responsive transcriptional regulator